MVQIDPIETEYYMKEATERAEILMLRIAKKKKEYDQEDKTGDSNGEREIRGE